MSTQSLQQSRGLGGTGRLELRVARIVPDTRSEGPFRRFALWVQGCSLRCPGCCNPDMQDANQGNRLRIDALLGSILAQPGIEGISLLGGEPFEQAAPLAALCREARAAGLGVLAFSGYTLDALRCQTDGARLLAECDALVDGPYLASQACRDRRWIGSSNQQVHFLTARYRACQEFARPGQSIHVTFADDQVTLSGFPVMLPSPDRIMGGTAILCEGSNDKGTQPQEQI